MEFTIEKPPIVQNSQSSIKRSFNLHIALVVVSIAAIVLKTMTAVPVDATYTALDQAYKVFFMLIVGVGISLIVEFSVAIVKKTTAKLKTYEALIDPINSGLLIALLLPTQTPIYVLILAVVIGVYLGKLMTGGYGHYIFNPALIGVLFVKVVFGSVMYVASTPLKLLQNNIDDVRLSGDNVLSLLIGNYEGIAIGSTATIILLLVMVYLVVTRVSDYLMVMVYLLVVGIMSFIIGSMNGFLLEYMMIHLFGGLTLFGATFLVAEPVSSPTSRETKVIYAVMIGVIMMFVRVFLSEGEGLMIAVLFGNMMTPFIHHAYTRSTTKGLIKVAALSFVFVVFIGFVLGYAMEHQIF